MIEPHPLFHAQSGGAFQSSHSRDGLDWTAPGCDGECKRLPVRLQEKHKNACIVLWYNGKLLDVLFDHMCSEQNREHILK